MKSKTKLHNFIFSEMYFDLNSGCGHTDSWRWLGFVCSNCLFLWVVYNPRGWTNMTEEKHSSFINNSSTTHNSKAMEKWWNLVNRMMDVGNRASSQHLLKPETGLRFHLNAVSITFNWNEESDRNGEGWRPGGFYVSASQKWQFASKSTGVSRSALRLE